MQSLTFIILTLVTVWEKTATLKALELDTPDTHLAGWPNINHYMYRLTFFIFFTLIPKALIVTHNDLVTIFCSK